MTKAKRTSITSNQDAGKADKAKQVQWTTWTIRGRRGASGSSLGSGRKVALLALGRPSCKPRHVSSGVWAGEGGGSADVAGGDCRSADGLIQRLLQKTQISSAHRATIHHGAPRVLARQDQWKFLIFLTPKTIVRHDKNESTMVNYGRQIPNTEVKSCLVICRTLYWPESRL